ncbi:MAG: SPFH domain-containing protein [Candidatus Yanofskybacteria bacterium]|nr:SPFH domain-containing protein [Candidatus Yanofskybacteria bacterium]
MREFLGAIRPMLVFAGFLILVSLLVGWLVFGLPRWANGLVGLVLVAATIFWLSRATERLGAKDPRCVALIIVLGNPVDIKGFGLVAFWWPVVTLWKAPTAVYWWEYEIRARTKDGIWVKFIVRVNWQYPVDPTDLDREFHFPVIGAVSPKGSVDPKRAADIPNTWKPHKALELLKKTYASLPQEPLKTGWQDLRDMFQASTEGSFVQAVSQFTLKDLEAHQDQLEATAKVLMLQEPGDVPHDLGCPSEFLDIRATLIETERVVTDALQGPKIAEKEAEAEKKRAEGRQAAASAHAAADKERIDTLVEAGVDPDTAAALVTGGAAGSGGANLDTLERIALIKALQKMGAGQVLPLPTRQRKSKKP